MKGRALIENVSMPLANTEYSYEIPKGARKFSIKLRELGYVLQVCFISGISGTTYITLDNGKTYTENDFKGGGTLYFRSNKASQVAEILVYL